MFEEPEWSIDRASKRKKKKGEDDNDVSITKVGCLSCYSKFCTGIVSETYC